MNSNNPNQNSFVLNWIFEFLNFFRFLSFQFEQNSNLFHIQIDCYSYWIYLNKTKQHIILYSTYTKHIHTHKYPKPIKHSDLKSIWRKQTNSVPYLIETDLNMYMYIKYVMWIYYKRHAVGCSYLCNIHRIGTAQVENITKIFASWHHVNSSFTVWANIWDIFSFWTIQGELLK